MPERAPLERRSIENPPQFDDSTRGRPVLTGYATLFNQRTVLGGARSNFVEVIRPGALARLRERRDVKALISHDISKVVGSTKAGTLALDVDSVGLRFRLTPPDSPIGADLVESVRRGDIDAMSIGFVARESVWHKEERPPVRELLDLDVFEVSFVAFPAVVGTSATIEARALAEAAHITAAADRAARLDHLRALEVRIASMR